MPNPRNRIKQTGDTRYPQGAAYELEDDLEDEVDATGTQPEAAVFHPAASGLPSDGAAGAPGARSSTMATGNRPGRLAAGRQALQERGRQLGQAGQGYLADARGQVVARPVASLGGAFLLGFVLARLTR
jgi:hypothetical protein